MSDPIEWQDSWLSRASELLGRDGDDAGRGALPRLLRLIHEGTRLRRRLDESDPDPLRPSHPEVDDLLERLQDEATARLSALDHAEPVDPKLVAITSRRLRSDQSYLGALLTRPGDDPVRKAALLDRFRRDLTWLSELVALVEGGVPTHPAVSARIELDRLKDAIQLDRSPGLGPRRVELSDRAEALRRSLLEARIGQILRRPIPDADPPELWARRFLLSRLQAEVEAQSPAGDGADSPRPPLAPALVERREALAASAADRLRDLPPEAASLGWDDLLAGARGESNEIVSLLEELEPRQAVLMLDHSREDMLRLGVDCEEAARRLADRGADRQAVGHLRRLSRRFRRMARTARNEWQEKQLSSRLEDRFGPKFPRAVDGLILVLILVLTAQIIVEVVLSNSGRLTPRLEAAFAWLDLAICSVFLADLGVKLSLVSGKLLYLRRHFLIDVLPSIPFGFLAFVLVAPSSAGTVGAIRMLRLPRLIRYIRLLRPAIRFARLFIFFFRFTDRLVRRYASVFNRNIILFEPKSDRDDETRNRHLLYLLRRHFERRAPEHFSRLDAEQRLALAELGLEDLGRRLAEIPSAEWSERVEDEVRDIPIEEVVERLIELTPEELVEQMGPAFVGSIDRYLQLFDVPVVRRLPAVRTVLEHRRKGPAEAGALAANYLGYAMQRALDVVYYFADLQATVSPPLFLDKLGRTIVNATRRPAFRLLTFGVAFAALYALVYLLVPASDASPTAPAGVEPRPIGLMHAFGLRLRSVLGWFADKLGLPVIVIGVVCFALMQVGSWFRRIANQAAEFCERVVEAQFASQTKSLKQLHRERDLRFLAERVTAPEIRLRTSDDLDGGGGATDPAGVLAVSTPLGRRRGDGEAAPDGDELGLRLDARIKAGESDFLHTLRLLYQDYLDGSPFHRNDTKASTQLLGNLALRNLSLSNLPYFLKGRKRLDRLDLSRAAASLFGGPYLWFDYITRMIVQETAKLLIDFNRHAVPLDRLACSPESVRARYRRWLSSRLGVPEGEIALPGPVGSFPDADRLSPARERAEAAEFFETVDFTAVDFLIADAERDEEIRARYGDAVVALLQNDREQNLRGAFRSLPLHRAPASQRTINVFHLYESFLAKGKLLVLPLRILWWAARGAVYVVARVSRVIREILHPTVAASPTEPEESYEAAVRKIHRMRKPAFMESLRLRAQFDVEYLGLPLPSVPISVGSDSLMEIDLDFIGASRHERVMADRFREGQRARIARFSRWLGEFGWDFDGIAAVLHQDLPHLVERRAEVLRALVTAWVADHDDVATLGTSIDAIRAVVSHGADPSGDPRRLPEGLPEAPGNGVPLWHAVRDVRRPIAELLDLPCVPRLDGEARARASRYLRKHRRALKGWTRILRGQGGADPVATLRARLAEVMLRTDLWSDQILTLRTVQTLTMLDLQHYTELVWTLGGFGRLDPSNPASELPFEDREEAEEALVGG
ncbi:ion transporter [Tautonia plasticadhaerens]|uniref:Ion transport domain-containing protein n=1 Tax=Tautonia plasticadhaerens TaxID=2527974 RepID=A0A518H5G3_9BACT|nr:ion transporter [Tautonia plasticadhaerens]QDV36086.1 hypothetical protein ElP_39980 [Tautonia plasticadhaerens]